MNVSVERWCLEAINEGLTPEDITLSIKSRRQFNSRNSAQKSLMIHRMLMSSDDRAVVLNEAAEMRAKSRIIVMDKGKASVLAATGRSTAPPQDEAKAVADLELMKSLRRSAQ